LIYFAARYFHKKSTVATIENDVLTTLLFNFMTCAVFPFITDVWGIAAKSIKTI